MPERAHLRRPRRQLAAAVVIAAAALAVYLPALGGGYVFDDHQLVETNALLRGPLARIWLDTDLADFWPLTYSTFWVELRLFGPRPWVHHLVNVALHAVMSVLLWRVLRRLTIPGAWVAGLLFALHPTAVESVAWISERKNVLAGVLVAGSALAWLRHKEEGGWRSYAVSLSLFAMALLSKTSAVVLPPVLLGIALLRPKGPRNRAVLGLAPFFALAIAMGLVTIWSQSGRAMGGAILEVAPAMRPSEAAWALWSYLQKAFVPVDLGFVYPRWPVSPESLLFHVPLALTLLVAALSIWAWRMGARTLPLALACHAVMVAPVLGFIDMFFFDFSRVSNHLQHLALVAPVAAAGIGLERMRLVRPRAALAVASALALVLGARTALRAAAFQDDLSLWAQADLDQPQAFMATWMHSFQLDARGRRDEASEVLRAASERFRDPADRHRARSLLALRLGDVQEAREEALAASALRPDPVFDHQLGSSLLRSGHAGEAVVLLAPLVQRDPASVPYRLALGAALAGADRGEEAVEVLRVACRLAPRRGDACAAMLSVLRRSGSWRGARAELAAALGLPPYHPDVEAALGRVRGDPR